MRVFAGMKHSWLQLLFQCFGLSLSLCIVASFGPKVLEEGLALSTLDSSAIARLLAEINVLGRDALASSAVGVGNPALAQRGWPLKLSQGVRACLLGRAGRRLRQGEKLNELARLTAMLLIALVCLLLQVLQATHASVLLNRFAGQGVQTLNAPGFALAEALSGTTWATER